MGEGGGFQQIIVIGLVLLFGLADLMTRWAKGRMRSQEPGEPTRRPAQDDPWQVDVPWRNEDASNDVVVVSRPVRVEVPARMPTRTRESAERARAPRERTVRDRTSSVRQAVLRSAPVRPVAPRLAAGGISARDRMAAGTSGPRARGLTFSADDARRGVIAMTVLGPCRALEEPARGL
jgi:hypothetical protein